MSSTDILYFHEADASMEFFGVQEKIPPQRHGVDLSNSMIGRTTKIAFKKGEYPWPYDWSLDTLAKMGRPSEIIFLRWGGFHEKDMEDRLRKNWQKDTAEELDFPFPTITNETFTKMTKILVSL